MLEAGPPRVPDRDFSEHMWPYGLRFRGFGDQKTLLREQPVQRLKASGIAYIARVKNTAREVSAKVVVLAAAALESTRILLNSRSRRFPDGLGPHNEALGHYLMDHSPWKGPGGFCRG